MITIEGLSKTYAGTGRPALNDIALQIPKGAIYGILGRSGAGKSTLIRCLNLLERPTSGRILVNGQDITQLNKAALRDYRLRTGMIFQMGFGVGSIEWHSLDCFPFLCSY
ncbi:hypothetical protein DD584_25365 [Klebsiella pneumoniae]|nr:hypothetical protein DD584_25365 [Klebsiella pneumoniae]